MDDGVERIGTDPFAVPEAERDPARRFRGRLTAGVTVWTADGPAGRPVGLTVSSVLVAEGEPPELMGLVGSDSELLEAVGEGGRFVVHVLGAGQTRLADQFALRYPGDPFEGVAFRAGGWGPVLEEAGTRASCTVTSVAPAGWGMLVRARVDAVELDDGTQEPLVVHRGRYLTVAPRR